MKNALSILLISALTCAIDGSASAIEQNKYHETLLYSFSGSDGETPESPLLYVQGALYGTTYFGGDNGLGALYSFNIDSGQENLLFSFADSTQGMLTYVNGTLYGTTDGNDEGWGTIFEFSLNSGTGSYLYGFCSKQNCADGAFPRAGLLDAKGLLFGTTFAGGAIGFDNCDGNGCGTVFSISPTTGGETVLYSFCKEQECADGSAPSSDLIDVKGILYGTTQDGGDSSCPSGNGCGTVFSLELSSGIFKTVYAFCSRQSCADGATPYAGLTLMKGRLYGTTVTGGAGCTGSGCGTVFSIDPSTGIETVVYTFQGGSDGTNPWAKLLAVKGKLYGTTEYGGGTGCGGQGCGTVFSIDPKTGVEKQIYVFRGGSDGENPMSGLTEVDGTLYGTTLRGGAHKAGTLFALKAR